ncbi:MAG: hypothetical protein AAF798_05690 [Bacteroidota bacterium]
MKMVRHGSKTILVGLIALFCSFNLMGQDEVSKLLELKPTPAKKSLKELLATKNTNPLKGLTLKFADTGSGTLKPGLVGLPVDKAVRNANGTKINSLRMIVVNQQPKVATIASITNKAAAQQAYSYWSKQLPPASRLLEVQNLTNKTVLKYKDAKGVVRTLSKSLRKNAKLAGVAAAMWATYQLLPAETQQEIKNQVLPTNY